MSWRILAWLYGIAFLAALAWAIRCVAYFVRYAPWDQAT
jgi:hypothetical protein